MSLTSKKMTACFAASVFAIVCTFSLVTCAENHARPEPRTQEADTSYPPAPETQARQTESSIEEGDVPESFNPARPAMPSSNALSQTQDEDQAAHSSEEAQQKQAIWIVDTPARTEVIHHDAQGYWTGGGYYTLCTICGTEIAGSPMAHMDSEHPTALSGSWTDVARPSVWVETSPAWDELITTPELGHWEYR